MTHENVLMLLSKRNQNVKATIFTGNITKQLETDLKKHHQQYPAIELTHFSKSHDRFLIIDMKTVYHIGASLKDLGKKPVVSLSNYGLPFPKSNSMHQRF